jgi:D-sedoheptulose 7-phosphate isomerase
MTTSGLLAPNFSDYAGRLNAVLALADWDAIDVLAHELQSCWRDKRQVFICGNGGSAANALHISNDLFYGIAKNGESGLRVHALPSNVSVLTCLANDRGYENSFSLQLETLASPGDLLIVLSGSGNSPNILAALESARRISVRSWAILGFSGGAAKSLADRALHFSVDDMQISEDLQLIVGHMLMQWLCRNGCGL